MDLADMERAELWAASVRRDQERRRRELRAAWYGHHEHMRELHAGLSREHEEKAMKLLDTGPERKETT